MPEIEPVRRGPGRPAGARSGETRDAILRATRALLAEQGMARVTLREVAERAGVQPALVNYYFGGKQELFRDVIREVASGVRERIAAEAQRPGEPEERLGNAIRAVAGAFAADPYAPRLLLEQVLFAEEEVLDDFVEDYARPNLAVLQGLLESGQRAGRLRDVDPSFLVPQVMGMLVFFFLASPLLNRIFDFDGIDADLARRYADSAAELLLHGVAMPEAQTQAVS